MKKETFPIGKMIFSEGDPGKDAYRIISGRVDIFIQEDSQQVVLATLGEGEIFGEMAMIEKCLRSASARVLETTEVEIIERDHFLEVLESGGQQLLPLLSTIFERLRVTNDRLLTALDKLDELEPKGPRRHREVFGMKQSTLAVIVEADSEEMMKQTVLNGRVIERFPFLFGRRSEIAGGDMLIRNQLLLADRTPYRVSRKHCYLQSESDGIYIEDSSSKLGTIVNGVSIGGNSREDRVKLSPGENTLVLGGPDSQVRFKVEVVEPE